MRDFWYWIPTRINFGPSCFQYLIESVQQWGKKPLIVYGGGSIKRNGAYDAVVSRLQEAGIPYAEMGGVAPNPRLGSVRKGIEILKATCSFPSAAPAPSTAPRPLPPPQATTATPGTSSAKRFLWEMCFLCWLCQPWPRLALKCPPAR